MGWSERQNRLKAAVAASLWLDAQWNDAAEVVRVGLRDADAAFGRTVVDQVTIRVSRSDVEEPARDDVIEIVEDGRRFQVIGTPLLDRKQNWICEAKPID